MDTAEPSPPAGSPANGVTLLGPAEIRQLAAELDIRPAKSRGQNFVHDPNTIRRIVRAAGVTSDDVVLEVGPGLGSLSLGLLAAADHLTAIEIDERLAFRLPQTVAEFALSRADRLTVVTADALQVQQLPDPAPTVLVANLPYNVAVPVLLTLLARFDSIERGLIMVQLEVADRLAARPGSKIYGAPSAKLAWYADARRVGTVPRSVFWPVPNVESGLVVFDRQSPPRTDVDRETVFEVVDAAFAQRRKMLRSALAGWAGSAAAAETIVTAAGVSPYIRGETIGISDFAKIAYNR